MVSSCKRLFGAFLCVKTTLPTIFVGGFLAATAFLLIWDGRDAILISIKSRFFQSGPICMDGQPAKKITVGGDILLGRRNPVWRQIVQEGYDADAVLGDAADLLRNSDAVFFNFEGILVSREQTAREKDLPVRFSIGADPEILTFLRSLNQRIVLSFANNHSADFGIEAIERTMEIIMRDSGVVFVGIGRNVIEATAPQIIDFGTTRVAFLAFTDLLPDQYYATASRSGVAALTEKNLHESIVRARKFADIVIVSLHTGVNPAKPFSVVPDAQQWRMAYGAIAHGADLVVGHQSHGLQMVEAYQGKMIWHSLGIFLYNPDASEQYADSHPLHAAVEFYGGGLLRLSVCKEGITAQDVIRTKMVRKDGHYQLVFVRKEEER